MHVGAKAVSRFLGMGAAEFFPGKGALLDLPGEFSGEVNPGDSVFFQDPLMGGHGQGSLSLFELLEHTRIDEVGDDQVRLRALQAHLPDDSLHAANAGFF